MNEYIRYSGKFSIQCNSATQILSLPWGGGPQRPSPHPDRYFVPKVNSDKLLTDTFIQKFVRKFLILSEISGF